MDENQKAQEYQKLMQEYVQIENVIKSIPQLSLDEQMKQVDATNKSYYNEENKRKVNELKQTLNNIQKRAFELHLKR